MTGRSPIRCGRDSYLRIDNFYTATVYNKGAEVDPHDPHPARQGTGFAAAWTSTSGATTTMRRRSRISSRRCRTRAGSISPSFTLWYAQAGTPEITVEDRWDEASRVYELNVAQKVPPTPGQPEK